jgi:hypothetical protein
MTMLGWACSAYWGGERRIQIFGGKPEENIRMGRPGVDVRTILRRIFRQWDVRVWTGLSWLRIGQVMDICECGNEPSGSIKCVEFLDWLQTG